MLKIHIPTDEVFDEETNMFHTVSGFDLKFEHSLRSISEWESRYKKPFLSSEKTSEEMIDYFRMMSLDENFDDSFFSQEVLDSLIEYINIKPTATVINHQDDDKKGPILTSEVIYAYMANAQVPFTCDNWNIHRLMTLLEVIGVLNKPKKKMSQEETISRNKSLNEQRREKLGTSG